MTSDELRGDLKTFITRITAQDFGNGDEEMRRWLDEHLRPELLRRKCSNDGRNLISLTVESLIRLREDPNASEKVKYLHKNLIREFIRRTKDEVATWKDFKGETPLYQTLREKDNHKKVESLEVAKLLVESCPALANEPLERIGDQLPYTPLQFVAYNGCSNEMIRIIGDAVKDIDAQEPSMGDTALILASYAGNLEAVKYLLGKGADVNKKDHRKKNAYYWNNEQHSAEGSAKGSARNEIARLLREAARKTGKEDRKSKERKIHGKGRDDQNGCDHINAKKFQRAASLYMEKHGLKFRDLAKMLHTHVSTAWNTVNKPEYACESCHPNKKKIKEKRKQMEVILRKDSDARKRKKHRAKLRAFRKRRKLRRASSSAGAKRQRVSSQLEEEGKDVNRHGLENSIKFQGDAKRVMKNEGTSSKASGDLIEEDVDANKCEQAGSEHNDGEAEGSGAELQSAGQRKDKLDGSENDEENDDGDEKQAAIRDFKRNGLKELRRQIEEAREEIEMLKKKIVEERKKWRKTDVQRKEERSRFQQQIKRLHTTSVTEKDALHDQLMKLMRQLSHEKIGNGTKIRKLESEIKNLNNLRKKDKNDLQKMSESLISEKAQCASMRNKVKDLERKMPTVISFLTFTLNENRGKVQPL